MLEFTTRKSEREKEMTFFLALTCASHLFPWCGVGNSKVVEKRRGGKIKRASERASTERRRQEIKAEYEKAERVRRERREERGKEQKRNALDGVYHSL